MNNIFDEIKQTLLEFPHSKKTSYDNKINIRCRFCGDSQKSDRAHLGLLFKENIILFNCLRDVCGKKGLVNSEFLKLYGFDNTFIKRFIKDVSLSKFKDSRLKINGNNNRNHYIKKIKLSDNIMDYKLEYLKSRLNISDEFKKYKIVLDFNDFFRINYINYNIFSEKELKIIKWLQKNYVGFVSWNNSLIVCRNISSSSNKYRYNNLYFDRNNEKSSLYFIPKAIDYLAKSPKIIIAEGVFDIINVKNVLYKKDKDDELFASINGINNLNNAIKLILSITGFFDAELFIYGDKEVDVNFYIKTLKEFCFKNINVYINNDSKDFGEYRNNFNMKKIL